MVNMEELPLLVYDVDECSIGKSALVYAEQKHDIMLLEFSDVFHGEWNDVKKEAQNHGGEMWRSILKMTHCINMPYKNWGSSDVHVTRQEGLETFRRGSSIHSAWFQDNLQQLCLERGVPVPQDEFGLQEFFDRLFSEAETFEYKGDGCKMFRWS